MKKVQKTYSAEFKRETVRLAQTSGKPITEGWPVNWGSQTLLFISGARNWPLMETKPFQAVGIRRPEAGGTTSSQARVGGDPTGA